MPKGLGLWPRIALATGFWKLRGVTEQTGGVTVRTQHYFNWFGRGKMALPMGGGSPLYNYQGESQQLKALARSHQDSPVNIKIKICEFISAGRINIFPVDMEAARQILSVLKADAANPQLSQAADAAHRKLFPGLPGPPFPLADRDRGDPGGSPSAYQGINYQGGMLQLRSLALPHDSSPIATKQKILELIINGRIDISFEELDAANQILSALILDPHLESLAGQAYDKLFPKNKEAEPPPEDTPVTESALVRDFSTDNPNQASFAIALLLKLDAFNYPVSTALAAWKWKHAKNATDALRQQSRELLGKLPLARIGGGSEGKIAKFEDKNIVGLSTAGGREDNEDGLAALCHRDKIHLLVADGMGGHHGGEIASNDALQSIMLSLQKSPDLPDAFRTAQQEIEKKFNNPLIVRKPGTTMAAVTIDPQENSATVAHIGDTLVYLIRKDGEVDLLTFPQSLAALNVATPEGRKYFSDAKGEELSKLGIDLKVLEKAEPPFTGRAAELLIRINVDPEAARTLSLPNQEGNWNAIRYALGTGIPDEIPLFKTGLVAGERLLLVSDGLNLTKAELEKIIKASLKKKEAANALAERLKNAALKKKTTDNVTILHYGHRLEEAAARGSTDTRFADSRKAARDFEDRSPEQIELDEARAEINSLKTRLTSLDGEKSKLERAKNKLEEGKNHLDRQIEKAKEALRKAKEENRRIAEALTAARQKEVTQQAHIDRLEDQLATARQDQEEIETARRLMREKTEKIIDLEKELDESKAALEISKKDNQRLTQTKTTSQRSQDDMQARIYALEEAEKRLNSELEQVEMRLNQRNQELSEKNTALEEAETALAEARQTISQRNDEIEAKGHDIRFLEAELEKTKQQLDQPLGPAVSTLKKELEALAGKHDGLQPQLMELEKSIHAFNQEATSLQESLDYFRESIASEERTLEERISQATQDLESKINARTEIARLKEEMQKLNPGSPAYLIKQDDLAFLTQKERERHQEEMDRLRGQSRQTIEEIEVRIKLRETRLAEIPALVEEKETQATALNDQLQELETQIEQLKKNAAQLIADLQELIK